ncbi:MAG: sugar transferase, partial [Bacteroidales bacterium]|nr:sugar transferase [Bacteroidales bacterium]
AFGKDISLSSVSGIPLVRLTPAGMQAWEMNMKRIFDIFISIFGLICLSPLLLFLMLRVKMDSKGPIFFTQERLGKYAKTFRIIKFRTMRTDAEAEGPQLSSANDSRITKFGAIMRRYRLDELPQLLNVIKGDMSLVGPRPERDFYAKQILQQAPHYELIYQVRPGITSLGMAKFGYANTVEKMIERLDYDIIYLKQASLLMDIKILVFTIKPVLSGSGL